MTVIHVPDWMTPVVDAAVSLHPLRVLHSQGGGAALDRLRQTQLAAAWARAEALLADESAAFGVSDAEWSDWGLSGGPETVGYVRWSTPSPPALGTLPPQTLTGLANALIVCTADFTDPAAASPVDARHLSLTDLTAPNPALSRIQAHVEARLAALSGGVTGETPAAPWDRYRFEGGSGDPPFIEWLAGYRREVPQPGPAIVPDLIPRTGEPAPPTVRLAWAPADNGDSREDFALLPDPPAAADNVTALVARIYVRTPDVAIPGTPGRTTVTTVASDGTCPPPGDGRTTLTERPLAGQTVTPAQTDCHYIVGGDYAHPRIVTLPGDVQCPLTNPGVGGDTRPGSLIYRQYHPEVSEPARKECRYTTAATPPSTQPGRVLHDQTVVYPYTGDKADADGLLDATALRAYSQPGQAYTVDLRWRNSSGDSLPTTVQLAAATAQTVIAGPSSVPEPAWIVSSPTTGGTKGLYLMIAASFAWDSGSEAARWSCMVDIDEDDTTAPAGWHMENIRLDRDTIARAVAAPAGYLAGGNPVTVTYRYTGPGGPADIDTHTVQPPEQPVPNLP